MPRGRRTPHSAAALQRAVNHVELLEDRKLLTTLIGGDTFDYYDAAGRTVRLRLVGNITAEFIAVRNGQFGRKIVRDLVPSQFGAGLVPADGADLFSIYVSEADSDAQILISRVPNPTLADPVAADEDATPFSGSGSIRVPIEGKLTLLGLGEGGVYIGNRDPIPPTQSGTQQRGDEPNTVLPYRSAYGVRPAQRSLIAGIQTAPGVSIGKVMIGGTVTGSVAISGSVDTFYAGNILTGDIGGTFAESAASSPNNFYVGGDLRNLLVSGDIGTLASNEAYTTGTGIRVDGKLGQVTVDGTFRASLNVINSSEISDPLTTAYSEIEYKLGEGESDGTAFLSGLLSNGFTNDAEADGQYGASFTTSSGELQSLQFVGTIQNGESVDNYNVPLVAGQTITVDLEPGIVGFAFVGLYDPQGRLVASDVPELNGSGTNGAFRYTTQQPGNYRLQVSILDPTVSGSYDFENPVPIEGELPYTLTVQNVGELALGAVTAPDLLIDQDGGGVNVRNGDLGALIGTDTIKSGAGARYSVQRGNLRMMEGGVIGGVLLELYTSPQLSVPYGSVGLLRSTDGLLNVNPFGTANGEDPDPSTAIGFDYQVVESSDDFEGNLIANRAIGTVRAASILGAPIIAANADNRGQDGRIDLIDIEGDFGTLATGGPGLFTGLGGNVKYLRVGGDVYNDPFFGGGLVTPTTYALGESVRFTDDSGARGILSPTSVTTTTTGGGTGGGTTGGTTTTKGQLTVISYGIRGSGGVVLVNVASTTSVNIQALGTRSSFDIATLETEGEGTAVAVGGNNVMGFAEGTFPIPGTGTTGTGGTTTGQVFSVPAIANAILLTGQVPINVLDLQATDLTTLSNRTQGEIVGVTAASIGYMQAQRVGLSETSTPAQLLLDSNITPTAFPLDAFSYGVNTTNAIDIRSAEGVGTIAVSERLGQLTPNADGVNRRDRFEGINGVVFVGDASRINIGEGVAFGGTGTNPTAGIFAGGEINLIQGLNADIRGTIVAVDQIDRIALSGGSIVGARIQAGGTLDQASFLVQAFGYLDTANEDLPTTGTGGGTTDPNAVGPVHYNIGRLEITGGGILGSYIGGGDFDQIRVSNGFGILASTISFFSTNNASGSVSTDGLGIRGSLISPGNSLNLVAANGDGQRLNVNTFSNSVRQSEKRRFDSATGRPLAATSDLHLYLGTSASRGAISGVTNSGIIEDSQIIGAGNLRQLKAYHIRSTDTSTPISSGAFPMRVSFASSINKLDAVSSIDGLQVTTGRLDQLSAGGNISRTRVQASGRVGAVLSGRNIRGTFTMNVSGSGGELGRLYSRLAYYGTTNVTRGIDSVEVGTFAGQVQGSQGAKQLIVHGNVAPSGSTASPTFFRVNGTLGKLLVEGDVLAGTTIRAGAITEQTVLGTVFGNIIIT